MVAGKARGKARRLVVAQTDVAVTARRPRFGATVGSSVAVVSRRDS
jgi:hypothetical protein